MKIKHFFFFLIFLSSTKSMGQVVNLNYGLAKTNVRRDQLLGLDSSNASLNQWVNYQKDDSASSRRYLLGTEILSKKELSIKVLPITFKSVFNPNYPTYSNDGIIASQVGNQYFLTGGLSASSQRLSFQLSPEIRYQDIDEFSILKGDVSDALWRGAYNYWNESDAFTSGEAINNFILSFGQSHVYVNLGKVSTGIALSNLFWGPAYYHALVLSNHAPGFIHYSIHSNNPVKLTKLFNIEFQFVTGLLSNTEFKPPFPHQRFDLNPFNKIKQEEKRYLSAVNMTISPQFLKGLHFGINRSIQQYWSDTQQFENYMPIFDLFFRGNDDGRDDKERKDQLLSVNARWASTEKRIEIYYVYGRNDAAWNFRDLLMSPQHSMSQIVGFSKISSLGSKFFQMSLEWINTAQTINQVVRDAGSWYVHGQIRQGMTHKGEVLGAALPLGSNQQILDLNLFTEFKNLGCRFTRTFINREFAKTYISQTNIDNYWVQFSTEIYASLPYKRFLIRGNMSLSNHRNFQYVFNENRILLNSQFSISWLLR